MAEQLLRPNSLVLYKNHPALVRQVEEKLEIDLEGGKHLKVRPKDVLLLHPGPLQSLGELKPQTGDIKTAWELLAGSITTLAELAELIYDLYTPATAWATWQLINDGLYFRGSPETVTVATAEEVAHLEAVRQAKAAEEQAWSAFLDRARANQVGPADQRYLREIELLALGQNSKSRVLRELGYSESPENAHGLLLRWGHWDYTTNPYPQRFGLPVSIPTPELPPLPEEKRLDLTHLPAFAIDDEGSQDPDDALSLEGDRLWVHVADVAALISPDSPADLEARARGANLYLPEQTIPMLPPEATQLLGLGLQEISPALSFGLTLGSEGQVTNLEIKPSWVRVQRLSYEEVEKRLEEEPFKMLYHLASLLQARRRANGGIFIELPEVKVRVNQGEVVIRPLPPLKSRDLVQEAMLLAGEVIAHFALAQKIALPFTTQDPPEEQVAPQMESLASMFAARRLLKRSQLTTIPGPHAGLGLEIYAKATSPLRRYSDLVVHQQLRAYLREERPLNSREVLERVGAAEAVAGSVNQTERLARKHWTLVYLMNQPSWSGQGILVDKHGLRGLVLIPELDLETYVHLPVELPLDTIISLILKQVELAELETHFRVQGYDLPNLR
jgi:exoribonuclease-2